jgi:hypothetical protein
MLRRAQLAHSSNHPYAYSSRITITVGVPHGGDRRLDPQVGPLAHPHVEACSHSQGWPGAAGGSRSRRGFVGELDGPNDQRVGATGWLSHGGLSLTIRERVRGAPSFSDADCFTDADCVAWSRRASSRTMLSMRVLRSSVFACSVGRFIGMDLFYPGWPLI